MAFRLLEPLISSTRAVFLYPEFIDQSALPSHKSLLMSRPDPMNYLSSLFKHIRPDGAAAAPVLTAQRLVALSGTPSLAASWYYLAAAALAICNRPEEIPKIFHMALSQRPGVRPDTAVAERAIRQAEIVQHAVAQGPAPASLEALWETHRREVNVAFASKAAQKTIARNMREALLKGAALGGIPKAINALTLLRNATPLDLRETERLRSGQHSVSFEEEKQRGERFWSIVYGKVSRRVKGLMDTSYPDLLDWTLHHVYAPLLSYTAVLGPRESSLVVVACLVPQDVNPQLKGHLRGALNNGASLEEVRAARELAMDVCGWCGVQLKAPVAKL